MKWGHCKEGYRNHIVLAIVVNNEGLPFYWEVLPGGTADATTIAWLIERMSKRFKVKNTTLVFDRGMVSGDNLTLLEENEIKYIDHVKAQFDRLKEKGEELLVSIGNQSSSFTSRNPSTPSVNR